MMLYKKNRKVQKVAKHKQEYAGPMQSGYH